VLGCSSFLSSSKLTTRLCASRFDCVITCAHPWEKGGKSLNPEQAAATGMTDEIQMVSKFILQTDPAISSYLDGMQLNTIGRQLRDADGPQRSC
jgi:hypothetical protein